jgi:hypothetical protein
LVKDGHDIKKLYRRCEKLYGEEGINEFSIAPAHYVLLDALTIYLRWAGRYTRPHRTELVRLLVVNMIREGEGILPARKLGYSDLSSFYDKLASYMDFELRTEIFSVNMLYIEHISF